MITHRARIPGCRIDGPTSVLHCCLTCLTGWCRPTYMLRPSTLYREYTILCCYTASSRAMGRYHPVVMVLWVCSPPHDQHHQHASPPAISIQCLVWSSMHGMWLYSYYVLLHVHYMLGLQPAVCCTAGNTCYAVNTQLACRCRATYRTSSPQPMGS